MRGYAYLVLSLAAVLGLAWAAAGCGKQSSVSPPAQVVVPGDKLPPPSALKDLLAVPWDQRHLYLPVWEPVSTSGTQLVEAGLQFDPGANNIAWAIYGFYSSDPAYMGAGMRGSGDLWLLLPDYELDKWVNATPLIGGAARDWGFDIANPFSGSSETYVAVVCPAGGSGVLTEVMGYGGSDLPWDVRHVSPDGDDANDGDTLPWRTLQHAADVAQPNMRIEVEPGDYAGFRLEHSGSPGAPIWFYAKPGVTITPQTPDEAFGINLETQPIGVKHVVIEGFSISGFMYTGIRIAGYENMLAENITIYNCSCDNNGSQGLFAAFAQNLVVEACTFSNSAAGHGVQISVSGDYPVIRGNSCFQNSANGIYLNGDASLGGDGLISNALIENNVCHDNGSAGGSGIQCDGAPGAVIINNLLYGNHGSGITLCQIDASAASIGCLVANNTIWMAADGRWCLSIQNASTGAQVYNNILLNANPARGAIDLAADCLPGLDSDYNAVADRFNQDFTTMSLAEWRLATAQDQNSFAAVADGMFLDALSDDFRLNPFSPALDTGSALVAVERDLRGLPRPQGVAFDIGAYEWIP